MTTAGSAASVVPPMMGASVSPLGPLSIDPLQPARRRTRTRFMSASVDAPRSDAEQAGGQAQVRVDARKRDPGLGCPPPVLTNGRADSDAGESVRAVGESPTLSAASQRHEDARDARAGGTNLERRPA